MDGFQIITIKTSVTKKVLAIYITKDKLGNNGLP